MFALARSLVLRAGALLALCLLPFSASWATCTASNTVVSFPTSVSVQRDAPVGTVLATVTTTLSISCTSAGSNTVTDGSWYIYLNPSNPDYGAAAVASTRNTGYSGIGIQWANLSSYTNTSSPVSNNAFNTPYTTWNRGIAVSGVTTFTDTWKIVKTGPIASGTLTLPSLSLNSRTPVSNMDKGLLMTYTFPSLNVVVQACSVNTPTVGVPMGSVAQKTFTGIGTTSTSVPVTIALSCSDSANVNIQLAVTEVPGQAGTIQLNPDAGVATGVGVQILDSQNNPVTLNSRFLVGTTSAVGNYNINWKARYIQTATTVTPGVANATAVFTLTYL